LTLFCFITANSSAIFSTKMSFSVFRASLRSATVTPLRRTAAQAPNCNKILLRNTFSRKYSTPPPSSSPSPQPKSSAGLYVGVGAAVIGLGLAYYYVDTVSGKETGTAVKSGIQAAKVKVNFVPSKQDYINVN
jgi:cytochrome c peroxidase